MDTDTLIKFKHKIMIKQLRELQERNCNPDRPFFMFYLTIKKNVNETMMKIRDEIIYVTLRKRMFDNYILPTLKGWTPCRNLKLKFMNEYKTNAVRRSVLASH